VHGIRELLSRRGKSCGGRAIHAVMAAAGLDRPHASPQGLRHGLGVTTGIPPLNLVQKWLGLAQLSTTAIYANAVGAEEKDIARRMRG
jgi:site-specific recombinase XerD